MAVVKSSQEYLERVFEEVRHFGDDPSWFRGVRRAWDILPAAYWNDANEIAQMLNFQVRGHSLEPRWALGSAFSPFEIQWQRFFLAQHYGLATRLIDWTENPFVALHFAVTRASKSGSRPCVWILNPHRLNQISFGYSKVIVPSGPFSAHWLPDLHQDASGCVAGSPTDFNYNKKKYTNEHPIALQGPRGNPRLAAQLGVFSVHGSSRTPLNKIADLGVGQIRISVSAVPRIKRELERLGYRESSLFPELEKIGAEVRRDFAGSSASLPSTPKKRRLPAVDGSEPPRTKRSKAKKVVRRKPTMKKAARKKST